MISISIMGNPKRMDNIKKLQSLLGPVPYSLDDTGNLWENCKKAWRMYSPTAKFHLVLQDDAILCKDFVNEVIKILRDGQVYSLYFGYRKNYKEFINDAISKRLDSVVLDKLHWGLAVIIPTNLIEEMILFGDRADMPPHWDDTRIKAFIKHKKLGVNYPIPSLVDHDSKEVSLVTGQIQPGRKAFYFKGE